MLRYGVLGLAGLEAAVLLFMAAQFATEGRGGGLSGGPEMVLFFDILLPAVVLAGSAAAYRFARSRLVRGFAALAIAAPALALVYREVAEIALQSSVREDASGRGYFESGPAKRLGEAVVLGDTTKVAALARGTDLKQFGAMHETFLRLAMERTGDNAGLVATLLQAGADPNQDGAWPGDGGWPLRHALQTGDVAITTLLLDAGADPNRPDILGQPAFFEALPRPDLLALLLPRGVNLTAEDANGWTAAMVGVRAGRWAAVDMMLEAGSDPYHVAKSGLSLIGVIDLVEQQARVAAEPIPPELLALDARLRARPGASR